MAFDFWDTSALTKLYLHERGSEWAAARARQHSVAQSRLAIVEFASVVARRVASSLLTEGDRDRVYGAYLAEAQRFQIVELTEEILSLAAQLLLVGTFGTRVRAADAIHLATARWWFEQARRLNIEPGVFVVADGPLRDAAVMLGLPVQNPEDYDA